MAVISQERPSVNFPGAPDEEKQLVGHVVACVDSWENGIGKDFRNRCDRFYRQYRGFSKWRNAWVQAGPNDRDGLLYEGKQQWGSQLHIPLSFRTIEQKVPRAIAHRPRLLYLPRQERYAENVESVRLLIDAQQDNIDIDLAFQEVMRSGCIYGIGFGKTFWRKEYAQRRPIKKRIFRSGYYVDAKTAEVCTFDDPDFEACDVYDVFWDPFGSDPKTCGWMVHRMWLSTEAVLERVKAGVWNTQSAQLLTAENVRSMGSGQRYDEIWQERMTASGFSSYNMSTTRGEHIHEVWEYHSRDRVLTVLDRQVLVQDAEPQCLGHLPFQVYRPIPLAKQMVGIGELEPIEHLQREIDSMRSQMSDTRTLALAAGYAYDDAYIDEDDLTFGPFSAIRVSNAGNIQNALMPLPKPEMPSWILQHEQTVRQDMEVISALQDSMDPRSGQVGTATEAQLVQAALSARMDMQSRRFEIEVVRGVARGFLALDQRMILTDRNPIRLPDHGLDMQQAMEEGRWRWVPVGPGGLMGEFEIIPEGGSMAARNIPQDRQDAVQIMQLFGQNPYIDSRRPLLKALELFGEKDPVAWLKQSDPPVPPAALEALQRAGVSPQLIQQAVQWAQSQDPRLNQGPDVGMVNQAMGATDPNGGPAQ